MIQEHLDYARQLQDSRLKYGIDGIRQFVSDVDGDWLEKWGDDDMEISYVSAVYYKFDQQLAVTTNIEDVTITTNNINEQQAKEILYDLAPGLKLYVVPKRKDGYKLSEFGLGK